MSKDQQDTSSSPHFKSLRNQGFQIRFSNGYTVSVQYGSFNYCSTKNNRFDYDAWRKGDESHSSADAEVAVIDPSGNFVRFESNDQDVRGHTDPDTVAKIIAWVATLKP